MSKSLLFAFVSLLISNFCFCTRVKAQTGLVDPRKTDYICVLSRTINYTVDQNVEGLNVVKANGTVVVLPCEAASVRQDHLTDADYVVLEKMQAERMLWGLLAARPNSEAEARTTRIDFLKLAEEICGRHPKIALLPLDWKNEQTRSSNTAKTGGMILKTCSAL